MAWPFSKKKAESKSKPRPKHKPEDVKAKLAHLERDVKTMDVRKQLARLAQDLGLFQKVAKRVTVLEKELASVNKAVDSQQKETAEEFKSINKQFGPILDGGSEHDKRLKELESANKKLLSSMEDLERELKGVKEIVKDVEVTFSVDAFNRLAHGISALTKNLRAIEEDDDELIKTLQKVDKRIGTVEDRAAEVGVAQREAKDVADSLTQHAADFKDMLEEYSEKMLSMSSKVNAAISQNVDLNQQTNELNSRLVTTEEQLAALNEIRGAMDHNSQVLADISKRLAYLEKSTVKTLIVD